jgi:hypothetical protein
MNKELCEAFKTIVYDAVIDEASEPADIATVVDKLLAEVEKQAAVRQPSPTVLPSLVDAARRFLADYKEHRNMAESANWLDSLLEDYPVDPPRILVTVEGGVVQEVTGIPACVVVEVHDYDDGQNCDPEDDRLEKDAECHYYGCSEWGAE